MSEATTTIHDRQTEFIEPSITIPVKELEKVLLYSWDKLSPETQAKLRRVGVAP